MARRAPRYRLICGTIEHTVAKWQFDRAIFDGMAVQSANNERVAHVSTRFRARIHPVISFQGERLGDELRFELRDLPEVERRGLGRKEVAPAGMHSQFANILRLLVFTPPYNTWLTRIRENVGEIR